MDRAAMGLPGRQETTMKIETAQRLVAEAVAIAGHVPLYGEAATYEVRELKGADKKGSWITGCPTRDMMGYVRIPKRGQAQFIARVRDIIARREAILADRAERLAMARER
jgi:hypothetical protein